MRIKLSYIIIIVIILIGLRVFRQVQSETISINQNVYNEIDKLLDIDTGIVCLMIPKKTYYRIGEKPQLDILIINRTDSTIYLPGCLDGSDVTRLPYCNFRILNKRIRTGKFFLDANPNLLHNSDLQKLKPDDCFNPLNRYRLQIDKYPPDTILGFNKNIITTLDNYWIPQSLNSNFFLLPGKYKLQFVYSTIQ